MVKLGDHSQHIGFPGFELSTLRCGSLCSECLKYLLLDVEGWDEFADVEGLGAAERSPAVFSHRPLLNSEELAIVYDLIGLALGELEYLARLGVAHFGLIAVALICEVFLSGDRCLKEDLHALDVANFHSNLINKCLCGLLA